ncbi:hypothetical protein V6N12_055790 [Hibiscus sabdariffa]|uniref:ABC transporter domain-containing protein n=1 Tax=Hibiscus sabdariffa TaxID=183260 RepID=A0ABR2AJ27_9ROSI
MYGKVVVESKVPLPNYRPDLDDKRPQWEESPEGQKMIEFRKSLPAFKEKERLLPAIAHNQPADIYLIDEPSAYLDSEQRFVACKVIKRFILHAKKTVFVVEHDFIMAIYLADRVIVYEGRALVDCIANSPQSLLTGMNLFLSHLDITFRQDPRYDVD